MLKTRSFVAFSDVKIEFLISRSFALDSFLFLTIPYYHTWVSDSVRLQFFVSRIFLHNKNTRLRVPREEVSRIGMLHDLNKESAKG